MSVVELLLRSDSTKSAAHISVEKNIRAIVDIVLKFCIE